MSSDKDLLSLVTLMLKLESRGVSASEFARALVHDVLAPLNAQSAFICQLGFDSNIRFAGRYGFDSKLFHFELDLSVWEKCIVGESIREKKINLVSNRVDFEANYQGHFVESWPGESFVVVPLIKNEQALGALGVSFADQLEPRFTEIDFWQTVQLVAEAHFFSVWSAENIGSAGERSAYSPEALSGRQLRILALLSEGLTNRQIARELLISESSVKQETMRIYRALSVTDRKHASIKAIELGLVSIRS